LMSERGCSSMVNGSFPSRRSSTILSQ
jgi:hypothetical protein